MEPIETIKLKNGNTLEIYQDENHDSPREWDNLDTMICFHSRYNLGDEHDYNSQYFNSWEEFENQLIKEFDPAVILPLYLYDHSGITISTNSFIGRAHHAEWDSGRVGFILMSKKAAKENWNWKCITKNRKEQIGNYLIAQVKTYDQYLRGEIYGFQVKDNEGKDLDSCWGFYGSDWAENRLFEHLEIKETDILETENAY